MYGNTQMAILPLLPIVCICDNLDWINQVQPNMATIYGSVRGGEKRAGR